MARMPCTVVYLPIKTPAPSDRSATNTINPIALWAAILTGSLVIGLGIQFVAAWTTPKSPPPADNVLGPITTGSYQTKSGGLFVNSNGDGTGLGVLKGRLSVGQLVTSADTANKQALLMNVNGKVGATEYCDQDGNNCVSTGSMGVSTGDLSGLCYELTSWSPSTGYTTSCNNNVFPAYCNTVTATKVKCACNTGFTLQKFYVTKTYPLTGSAADGYNIVQSDGPTIFVCKH